MRQTKIIATLGPASDTDEVLDELIAAGTDIFRLNFAHGSHDSHAAVYTKVRNAADRAGRVVAILQDLSGPKIRTGRLAGGGPIALIPGQELRIAVGDEEGNPHRIFTTYADLPRVVPLDSALLLDDGRIELTVVRTEEHEIITTVVDGGLLGEHKGINAPGVTLPVSPVTPKDIADLTFGLELGVDMVAVSFVRRASDLSTVRGLMTERNRGDIPIVAKLERPEALAHLSEIIDACDAVMVARGDLGLEMPLETVPRAQKEITMAARARGVPVIVATQVLESMRTEPRPTRAEVSDAANAVDDGVDAIMLAGETAVGAFPVRAVRTLDAVIREAEAIAAPEPWSPTIATSFRNASSPPDRLRQGSVGPPKLYPKAQGGHYVLETDSRPMKDNEEAGQGRNTGHEQALCESAVTLARLSGADALIAVTQQGNTARRLSALRSRAPVYAATARIDVARRLTLCRGVFPLVTSLGTDVASTYADLARRLCDDGRVPPRATVVFVNVAADLTKATANFLRLMQLG